MGGKEHRENTGGGRVVKSTIGTNKFDSKTIIALISLTVLRETKKTKYNSGDSLTKFTLFTDLIVNQFNSLLFYFKVKLSISKLIYSVDLYTNIQINL